MENIFKRNFSQSQIEARNKLKANLDFSQRIINDLRSTFYVTVEQERLSENQFRSTVYRSDMSGRDGFGFRFEATVNGVSFTDEWGVWDSVMAKILSVDVSGEWDQKKQDFDLMKSKLKSFGTEIAFTDDTQYNGKYRLKINLTQDETLDEKIKLIIAVLMSHGVTTKI